MLHLFGLIAAFVLGGAVEYCYLRYRHGSSLTSDLKSVETRIQDISKVVKK